MPAPALDSRPQLPDKLQWIYTQYSSLTRERVYAHDTPLPLRLSDIDLYWSRFIRFDYEDFYDQIVLIDNVYLKRIGDRREAKRDPKKVTPKKPVR